MSAMHPDYDIKITVKGGRVTMINYDNLAIQENFQYMLHKDVIKIVKDCLKQAIKCLK